MRKISNLRYLIENEFLIQCPLLPMNSFISYCKDRGIRISSEQLERFEELGIFYPVARVRYPKVKVKIEYVDDGKAYREFGILKDGEEYAGFRFNKKYAIDWLDENLLWQPSSESFQAWKTFKDEKNHKQVESFYSIFQCYPLYDLVKSTTREFKAEWWLSINDEQIDKWRKQISEWAKATITRYQENNFRTDVADICQVISNRYFPVTQSDQRSIHLSTPSEYYGWDWYEYCRNWNPGDIFSEFGIDTDHLKSFYQSVVRNAQFIDPLERWYDLVTFVSVEKKQKLKKDALLSQTFYSMAQMIALFYENLTGQKLGPGDEMTNAWKDNFYGKGVTENELLFLEFLTNEYQLNPKPNLILVVEGNGEEEQFPRLAKKFFGLSFPRLGIEVVNLTGISHFSGKPRENPYSALEKFIDYHHHKQTFVFIVLDNDDTRIARIARKLKEEPPPSIFSNRKITTDDLIHLWNKTIEFDNFSHEEIALAMTKLCKNKYVFTPQEIAECEPNEERKGQGNPLGRLYQEKLSYSLEKPALLGILFDYIIDDPSNELNKNRQIVKLSEKIIKLVIHNFQPIGIDIWKQNQESGYFGTPL